MGLYTPHYGEQRNAPVYRAGNIASLRENKVRGPLGAYVSAYLIDLWTIGGLSGSPVFFNISNPQTMPVLLGILIGYHEIESAEDQIMVPAYLNETKDGEPLQRSRNTGFGLVIPFEVVLDILDDNFVSSRDDWLASPLGGQFN